MRLAVDTWLRRLPPAVVLMLLAAVTGTCAGVGAWLLKYTIGHLSRLMVSYAVPGQQNWWIGLLPVAGIMMAAAYQRYVVHESLEHGTDTIQRALAQRCYYLRRGLCYQPLLASIITLGLGGSAGAEGPIATAGAAMGSNIARLAGVSPAMVRVMIGCGAGAGIAGIFKAPVGGALFTLEVLKMPLTTMTVMALLIASICGAMTCYALTGFSFDVRFLPASFFDPWQLGWVCALGVFCGLYAIYYNNVTGRLHRLFRRIPAPWLLALAGGAIVGVCLVLFPAMYGEGYGVVTDLVNNQTLSFTDLGIFDRLNPGPWGLAALAAAVLLLKVFATIASNSAGGVAGDFAPTIFAGAFAGMLFAWIANMVFDANLPVGLFALFGTAGAFAGIIHAPLMATFLVAEMVGSGYGFFLPLAVSAAMSYLTVKLLTPNSRYRAANHDDLDALMTKDQQ